MSAEVWHSAASDEAEWSRRSGKVVPTPTWPVWPWVCSVAGVAVNPDEVCVMLGEQQWDDCA